MKGDITDKIYNEDQEVMPYDRIFIPEGKSKTISDMTLEEKNTLSQRGKAFKKFGDYIINNNKLVELK